MKRLPSWSHLSYAFPHALLQSTSGTLDEKRLEAVKLRSSAYIMLLNRNQGEGIFEEREEPRVEASSGIWN